MAGIHHYPTKPTPLGTFDWRQRARDYDAFVYNWADRGNYTTIRADSDPLNMPAGSVSYTLPAYYGDIRVAEKKGVQEAVCQIASVVGATLAGIDKSKQDGRNYVDMLRTFYHPDLRVALNTPSLPGEGVPGSDSIWYTTTANVLYWMLGAQYSQATGMTDILRNIADTYCSMVDACGGADADLTMQDFDFITRTRTGGRNEGGDAAAGAAAILMWAHARHGDAKYLQGAKWAMDYLERSGDNIYYEILMVLAPYVAARLNAEQGTSYDVSKYFNWLMQGSAARVGWGTIDDTWAGYTVHGLAGSRTDTGGYAFAMNAFANTLTAATAKYDPRYAVAVGRWMLNLHNAARFFYADQMPASKQYYEDRFIDDPAHVIAYEGLMKTGPDGIQARSDVPTRSDSWGLADSATGLGLYGSSWVGFLAAAIAETDVSGVLRTDLNILDFHGNPVYPTHLYYNPGTSAARVRVRVGRSARMLYDSVSDSVLDTNASGTVIVDIPAGSARVLVQAPAGGTLTRSGRTRLINDVAVGYDAMPAGDLAAGRPVTASSEQNAVNIASNLTDGSPFTRWESASSDPQWFTVDLEQTQAIGRAVLVWETAAAKAYTLQVSTDNSDWTTVYSTASGTAGRVELPLPEGTSGRYVRVHATQRATQYAYSAHSVSVYAPNGGA
ncbi:discoidin domain-containing protein [Streptomyces aculeolatus]